MADQKSLQMDFDPPYASRHARDVVEMAGLRNADTLSVNQINGMQNLPEPKEEPKPTSNMRLTMLKNLDGGIEYIETEIDDLIDKLTKTKETLRARNATIKGAVEEHFAFLDQTLIIRAQAHKMIDDFNNGKARNGKGTERPEG